MPTTHAQMHPRPCCHVFLWPLMGIVHPRLGLFGLLHGARHSRSASYRSCELASRQAGKPHAASWIWWKQSIGGKDGGGGLGGGEGGIGGAGGDGGLKGGRLGGNGGGGGDGGDEGGNGGSAGG